MTDTVRFPAEWEKQDAVILTWPNEATDWAYILDEVVDCYVNIARAIIDDEDLVIVTCDENQTRKQLGDVDYSRVHFYEIANNDTWARDFGPIGVIRDGKPQLLDFTFNAWGMKFAADCDNLITSRLADMGAFDVPVVSHRDMVLEGGSVESDGNGAIMTTSMCLLQENRNPWMTREQIEKELKQRLGAEKILWIENGYLTGDDTDGHVDTIARFAPGNTIVYVGCDDENDEQYESLKAMEDELKAATNAQGVPYRLLRLPSPDPICENDLPVLRLPATYANFLIMNHQVLVPVYGQPADEKALAVVQEAFPDHKIVGIDCNALIKQHGSLHCVTMQLFANTLKK